MHALCALLERRTLHAAPRMALPASNPYASRKILVIGGTGLIGTKLVKLLRDLKHDVIAASPSKGINSVTGEGLVAAMSGVEIVVDVSNSPSWEAKAVLEFFEKSTSNLTSSSLKAGVKHYVALGVVGTERLLESGYFRAKIAQENLITSSKLPYTLLRATQFFEFSKFVADSNSNSAPTPTVNMQPVSSDDIAAALVRVALGAPANGIVELAGPDVIRQDDFARQYLQAIGDTRTLVVDPKALYYGAHVDDRSLVPTNAATAIIGKDHFADWLKANVQKK